MGNTLRSFFPAMVLWKGNSCPVHLTIPHNLNKLIAQLGGPDKAEAELDELTSHPLWRLATITQQP